MGQAAAKAHAMCGGKGSGWCGDGEADEEDRREALKQCADGAQASPERLVARG